jgi:uncharacterized protein YbcC (UPF0753/DUF2309 family)
MSAENFITELMPVPYGAETDRIRGDIEQIINENGLRKYYRVFTDESQIENQVGCVIVTVQTKIKHKLVAQQNLVAKRNSRADALKNVMDKTKNVLKRAWLMANIRRYTSTVSLPLVDIK